MTRGSSLIPLAPPQDEAECLAWLRLLRSRRVGIATFYRLIAEHGSARSALAALPGIARSAGVDGYEVCPESVVSDEMRRGDLAGARLLAIGGPGYPPALADISDPPPLLWCLGDPDILERPIVALVGARNASSLGLRMARSLAGALGKSGAVTASGLARGIDTEVHRASLCTGTVAVVAGGVDVPYPRDNAVLMQEIGEGGLILSEQPVGTVAQSRHFPRRNRIISGIARAVVVIEAAAKSGTLITAREALDQGRDVMAVPGHPFDARAAGCNMLIRDGATLVRGPADVIDAIGGDAIRAATTSRADASDRPAKGPKEQRPLSDTARLHSMILEQLGPSPTHEDTVIRDLGLPAADVTAGIVTLELDGRLSRGPGGVLSRIDG